MGRSGNVGELGQLVLLAVLRLGEGAYGVTIRRELRERAGRSVTPGTIYPTLERLERNGWLRSWMGEGRPERGGRPRRHYALEPEGLAEIRRAWGELRGLAEGLEGVLEGEG